LSKRLKPADNGVVCLCSGERIGALMLRLALGPFGALKLAGPRGGDLGRLGEGDGFGDGARTGDLSRGVDRADCTGSRAGDLSRVNGDLVSSMAEDCSDLIGMPCGDERRD
jgi:hypothetical protein